MYLTTLLPYPATLPYLTPHYHTITLLYPATAILPYPATLLPPNYLMLVDVFFCMYWYMIYVV